MMRCLFSAELFLILTQTIRLGLPLLAASGGDDAAFQEVTKPYDLSLFCIYLSLSVRQNSNVLYLGMQWLSPGHLPCLKYNLELAAA